MKELRNLYEHDGGMLEFVEKQIFKGKFQHEEEFTKRCNNARKKNQPYCYLHLTATTVKNAFQGVPEDRTVKMVVIIPLAFEKMPVLALENSRKKFVNAFNSLSGVNAIENSIHEQELDDIDAQPADSTQKKSLEFKVILKVLAQFNGGWVI